MSRVESEAQARVTAELTRIMNHAGLNPLDEVKVRTWTIDGEFYSAITFTDIDKAEAVVSEFLNDRPGVTIKRGQERGGLRILIITQPLRE